MRLLDEDWIAAAAAALAGLSGNEGADLVVDYVVAGAPDGKVTLGVAVEAGRVVSMTPGKSADPDVVISLTYDDAVAILSGEMTTDVAYMNAALKVEGDHKSWLLDLRDTRQAAISALAPVMADTDL